MKPYRSSFLKSFQFAISGLKYLFVKERNARVHAVAAFLAISAGFIFDVSEMEWVTIFICIGIVFLTEIFNTAIEELCDKIQPELDPKIKVIKDLSAGAVLIAAILSLVCGLIIFIPRIYQLIENYHNAVNG
ncbi:MAG: diacylglycerol kinase [Bacteroidia bacterium]